MARFGVGREHNLPWSVAGFHEINRYFHQDLSFVSFLRFSSFFFFFFPCWISARVLSVRTPWVQLRADLESIEQSLASRSLSLSLSPRVLFPLWSALRHENAWESPLSFSFFIRFPSFSRVRGLARSRGSHRVRQRVSVSIRTNWTAGVQLREKHAEEITWREKERKRKTRLKQRDSWLARRYMGIE